MQFLAFRAAKCGGRGTSEVEQRGAFATEKYVAAVLAILSDVFLLAAKQRAPLSWIRLGDGGGQKAGTGVRDWNKSGVAALYRRISRYLSKRRVYGLSQDERLDDDDDANDDDGDDGDDDDEDDNWCSACDAEKPSRVHHCDAVPTHSVDTYTHAHIRTQPSKQVGHALRNLVISSLV